MNVLVVGASGLVGGEIARQAVHRGHHVVGAARHVEGLATRAMDLLDRAAVDRTIDEVQPDVIFICSAWPYVDGCEKDPARSQRENVDTVSNLLSTVQGSKARLVYYSTDYVYDGSKAQYVESDPVRPMSVYARHKCKSEELLLEQGRHLVARIAWVFGEELRRKNFVYQVIQKARAGEPLVVPEQQAGCPTWSRWLSQATLDFLERGEAGVVHLTGHELVTKAQWAQLIVDQLRLPSLAIREVPAAESGQVAPRPVAVRLVSERHQLTQPLLKTILESERERLLVSG